MNSHPACPHLINPKAQTPVSQEKTNDYLSDQYRAALVQAALEAYLRKDTKDK